MSGGKNAHNLVVFLHVVIMAMLVLVNGCSTLGIATTKDMDALEQRLNQNTNSQVGGIDQQVQANDARLDSLENVLATEGSAFKAELDSLNSGFQNARQWFQTMDIQNITENSQAATLRSQSVARFFLQKLSEDTETLQGQLNEWEAYMDSLAGTPGASNVKIKAAD